ncbi:MAG TPA: BlaI/MecI/CopY family transcriptional regulator [Acidobacteriota bacterium]|nr:BlaI/MecI/CopY family transcriptional regulator [Acidobacteriota bacterium]
MKELTRAEEQIMHVLWALKRAYVKDIVERLPSPKPAYNTVSTIVRILEKKGFVDHEAFGKTYLYRPLVAKEDYTQAFLKHFVKDYFGDSYQELVSFFAKDKDLTVCELEEILAALREEIKKQKAEKNG